MISVLFSNESTHRVPIPYKTQKQALLRLAQAFVDHENSLLPEDRTRYTASIEAALADAQTAQTDSIAQEASRKLASETLKQLDAAARQTVSQIRSLLQGRFPHTPAQAQAWGFFVRQSGRGAGNILMPRGRLNILACLDQYILTEAARPIEEQFIEPPLAEVIALRDGINQQLQQRNQSRQERLTHNASLEEACTTLAKELRLALTTIVLNKYDGEPERELGRWGFEVVARTPRRPPVEEEEPEEGEPEETADPMLESGEPVAA